MKWSELDCQLHTYEAYLSQKGWLKFGFGWDYLGGKVAELSISVKGLACIVL